MAGFKVKNGFPSGWLAVAGSLLTVFLVQACSVSQMPSVGKEETSITEQDTCRESSFTEKILLKTFFNASMLSPYVNCTTATTDLNAPFVAAYPAGGVFHSSVTVDFITNETAEIFYSVNSTDTGSYAKFSGTPLTLSSSATLRYYAVDAAGNKSTETVKEFKIESGSVNLKIGAPTTFFPGEQSLTAGKKTGIQIPYSEYTGAGLSVWHSLGDNPLTTLEKTLLVEGITAQNGVISIPQDQLQAGLNHIFITDNATSYSMVIDVYYDDNYPLLMFSHVGKAYNESITLEVKANENAKIYYKDSAIAGSTFEYSSPLFLNTSRTLTFWAVDAAGNQSREYVQEFLFDFSAPIVTVTSAATGMLSGQTGAINTATFDVLSDQSGTLSVETGSTTLGSGTAIISGVAIEAGVQQTITIQHEMVNDGSNSFRIYVADSANNYGFADVQVSKDSVALDPLSVYPPDNFFRKKNGANLSFCATNPGLDSAEIAGLKNFTFQFAKDQNFAVNLIEKSSLSECISILENDLSDGLWYWRARYRDNLDNLSEYSLFARIWVNKAENDINGDGFSDFAVSSPYYGNPDKGRVILYFGSATAPVKTVIIEADQNSTEFGYSVDILNDFNGDGYSDIVIGEPKSSPDGKISAGSLYFFSGGADLSAKCSGYGSLPCTLTAANADLKYNGQTAGDRLGHSVKDLGDLNFDNLTDFAVNAEKKDSFWGTDTGEILIFLGKSTALLTPDYAVQSQFSYSAFGKYITQAMDFDRNGFIDFVVSAPYADVTTDSGTTLFSAGAVFMYTLNSTLLEKKVLYGNESMATFGEAVSAMDYNGDGYSDLFAGAARANSQSGVLSLYTGGIIDPLASTSSFPQPLFSESPAVLTGSVANGLYSSTISNSMDLNGNGKRDWLVCSPGVSSCDLMSYDGASHTILQALQGDSLNDQFGENVGIVGDINGDGFQDFIISSPGKAIAGNETVGSIRLYFGAEVLPDYSIFGNYSEISGDNAGDYFGKSLSGE